MNCLVDFGVCLSIFFRLGVIPEKIFSMSGFFYLSFRLFEIESFPLFSVGKCFTILSKKITNLFPNSTNFCPNQQVHTPLKELISKYHKFLLPITSLLAEKVTFKFPKSNLQFPDTPNLRHFHYDSHATAFFCDVVRPL